MLFAYPQLKQSALLMDNKPVRAGIFVAHDIRKQSKLRQERPGDRPPGLCRPVGAGFNFEYAILQRVHADGAGRV